MGLIADYMMINAETLGECKRLDGEELIEFIETLEDAGKNSTYSMDKYWDGLHFLLTRRPASEPIEHAPLSEAIVGIHSFDTEEDYFVAYTEADELSALVNALKKTEIDTLLHTADYGDFANAGIYPRIWDERATQLNEIFKNEFDNLLRFYETAIIEKAHVLISIY
jgi:hypothetical protein